MDLASVKDFKANVWYRGFKLLTVVSINNNKIVFSNADKIFIDENGYIHLNGKLVCTDTEISHVELLEMYKYYLLKKGYKFLD